MVRHKEDGRLSRSQPHIIHGIFPNDVVIVSHESPVHPGSRGWVTNVDSDDNVVIMARVEVSSYHRFAASLLTEHLSAGPKI